MAATAQNLGSDAELSDRRRSLRLGLEKAAAAGARARPGRVDPRITLARILQFQAEGLTTREIASQIGLTKGQVCGILFRARGGARAPRLRTATPAATGAPRFAPPIIGKSPTEWHRFNQREADQQFGAQGYFEDGVWWVAIPDRSWPGLLKRPIRCPPGRLAQVRASSEQDARQLALWAWGFHT
jgi:hypothetical protein